MKRLININKVLLAATAVCGVSGAAHAADQPTIGIVVPTLDSQFWERDVTFSKTAASQLGINLVVLNADNKPDQMTQAAQDLVARHVDGIISVGYWSTAPATIAFAKRANIPVIIVDTYPKFAPQSAGHANYIAFVGPSDFDSGYHMGKALLAAVPAGADGKKVIGIVNGTAGTSVAIDRRKGFQKAVDEDGHVQIVGEVDGNFVRDQAQTAFESLYQGHPDIKGVWAANDPTAMGVLSALKSKGKQPGRDVIVVGMDLNPENVAEVQNGEQIYDIGGHWVQGGIGLQIMYNWLHGHKLPADEATIKLKLLPMTKADVPRYNRDFPGGQPNYDFKAHSITYNKSAPLNPSFQVQYSQ
jgi:ABC-type sugar transport system substrate-binding protein